MLVPRIFASVFCALAMLNMESIARACASCGSGGDDPLILYPNERIKDYFGLSQSSNFKNIDPDGSESTSGGPNTKQTFTLATGRALSTRSFAAFTVPYIRNLRDGKTIAGVGDVSVAGRYSAILQSIDEPLIPQLQVLFGYKVATGRSTHNSQELKTLMDVTGTGFDEIKTGIDIWWGISRIKPGFSQLFLFPQAKSFQGVRHQPGNISRTTVSLGYSWLDNWKTTIGINREYRRSLRVEGDEQTDSAQLNHSLFFTSDLMITGVDQIRLSVSRLGAAFQNYSTSRSESFGLAYMHSY